MSESANNSQVSRTYAFSQCLVRLEEFEVHGDGVSEVLKPVL
jgi:hypothetical protein